ncbi:GH16389 [Drosophila grimshawi]|uniref:GH16389 n=1 Tax=Drosophila grimshawi TaxID=7222 RepID=B4JU80_DROGR|nr:GH16389 [Drosophila grimshawi]
MQLNIGFSYILLSLLLGVQTKPTFYVINKLLDIFRDCLNEHRPPPSTTTVEHPNGQAPPYYGPLILKVNGPVYDYDNGGGGGHIHGNGGGTVGHSNGQAPPYYGSERPSGTERPSGPLIQEGYDHGYDYYYGGGGGHIHGNGGGAVGHPYGQAPPARGYYPRPVQGPVKGYYGERQYEHQNYAPSGPAYGDGRSDPAGVGGYKQHGY